MRIKEAIAKAVEEAVKKSIDDPSPYCEMIVKQEREACAKFVETYDFFSRTKKDLATAIRERK